MHWSEKFCVSQFWRLLLSLPDGRLAEDAMMKRLISLLELIPTGTGTTPLPCFSTRRLLIIWHASSRIRENYDLLKFSEPRLQSDMLCWLALLPF